MARTFDGTDDVASKAAAPATAVPLTMACWYRPANVAQNLTLMSLQDTGVDDVGFWMQSAGAIANDPVRALTGAASVVIAASSAGAAGVADVWYHAAAVFVAANNRIAYFNGANPGTNATARTPTGVDSVGIGAKVQLTPTEFFSGRIAEAGLWNVALSANEVAALAKGCRPDQVRKANLIGYWPLFGTQSVAQDYSNQRNSLTYVGTTVSPHAPVLARVVDASDGDVPSIAASGSFGFRANPAIIKSKLVTRAG